MAHGPHDPRPDELDPGADRASAGSRPIDLAVVRERRRDARIAGLAAFLDVPAEVMSEALALVVARDQSLSAPHPDAA
jgi:hypothetical protein